MPRLDSARSAVAAPRSPRRGIAASIAVLLAVFGGALAAPSLAQADGPSTFSNPATIDVPLLNSPNQTGAANPYPSSITVSGMAGAVTKVQVVLNGVTHGALNDIDALVVAPTGANLVVLSDVGDAPPATLTFATNATLTFDDAAAGGVPTGNVPTGTYKPTNVGGGDAFTAPAPAPSGQTTLAGAFTGINPNGTWQLYVVDDNTGDVGSIAGWSLVITTEVAAVSTTTTVVTSGSPSATGSAVTFTASVTGAGNPVTTGSVIFTEGAATLGTVALNASGSASLTTSALAEGTHTIVATYSGSPGFLTSNGTVTQRVDNPTVVTGNTYCNTGALTVPDAGATSPYPSNITVSGLTAPIAKVTATLKGVTHTSPVDLDVMLSGPTPSTNVMLMSDVGGNSAVTGVNVVFDDAAAGGVPPTLASGTYTPTDDDSDVPDAAFPAPAPATSSATTLSTFAGSSGNGVWSLWVVDDANGDAGSISGGWCLTITTVSPTATSLTSSVNPSTAGQSVTLTATVTSGASPVTTGTVAFTDNGSSLGAPVAVSPTGTATLTLNSLGVGTHPITATFSGPVEFAGSSDELDQVVTLIQTSTGVTTSSSPSAVGQPVTFTATVTANGSPVTTGTVAFTDNGTPLGAAVAVAADGTATLTTASLAAGTHPITATYSGTAQYVASSGAVSQQVDVIPTSTAVSSAPNPSQPGQAVTFTATITANGSPVTTGTVTFADNGSPLGAAVPLAVDGTATLTTASLAAGTHPVTATYSGTAQYATSVSAVDQVVEKIPTSTSLASSANPSIAGHAVTFTATVTAGGAAVGVSSVVFADGGIPLVGAVALAADGTASITTSSLSPGTHDITATFTGDAVYAGSDDDLAQVVEPVVVADAGGPYSVAEGEDLELDGSGSSPGATYEWDVDGDGDFSDATGVSPTLTWAQLEALGIDDGDATPVARTVRVRVTSGQQQVTDTATLEVTNTAPATVVTGSLRATAGQPFTIEVGADDPSSADMAALFTYTVDWGDGTSMLSVVGPADPPVTHTYAAAGTYSATLTATDRDGATGAALSIQVVVVAAPSAPPPPASPTPTPAPTYGTNGLPTTGADPTVPLALAGTLLALGIVLVLRRRRRS
ncbi:Ig-like domain repeat protein [Microbacterium sp. AZCO]|uniref:Ig-like domain repeat protein n=1 Tax=Microbacterium sp. AZCO TaxID=3142976 RepID=UPI0031F3824E